MESVEKDFTKKSDCNLSLWTEFNILDQNSTILKMAPTLNINL